MEKMVVSAMVIVYIVGCIIALVNAVKAKTDGDSRGVYYHSRNIILGLVVIVLGAIILINK